MSRRSPRMGVGQQLRSLRATFEDQRERLVRAAEIESQLLQELSENLLPENLLEELQREHQKFDALSDAYATLRREHITALVRLHRAHGTVSAAALRHKDEKLAALARDDLRGLNKLNAEQKILRASEVLKEAGL